MANMVGKAGSTGALEEIVEETMRPVKNLFVYPRNLEVSSISLTCLQKHRG